MHGRRFISSSVYNEIKMEKNALNKLKGHPGIIELYTTFQVGEAPTKHLRIFTHIKQAVDALK